MRGPWSSGAGESELVAPAFAAKKAILPQASPVACVSDYVALLSLCAARGRVRGERQEGLLREGVSWQST